MIEGYGMTPACAGTTGPRWATGQPPRDDPRVCGDEAVPGLLGDPVVG